MSAPNTTDYAWLKPQPAVRSSWNGNNQDGAQSAAPASQSSSLSASPVFPLATPSSQSSTSPTTLQSKTAPGLNTGPQNVVAGLGDNKRQASQPGQTTAWFSGRPQDQNANLSASTTRTSETAWQTVSSSPSSSSSSQNLFAPFVFSSSSLTTPSQAAQKENGHSPSPSPPPSTSSIFGTSQIPFVTSTRQASQQESRPQSSWPSPFSTSIPSAKQPASVYEVKAPGLALSPSTFTPSLAATSAVGNVQATAVGSTTAPETKSESCTSSLVQVTTSATHSQSGTAYKQTGALNISQSPVRDVTPEAKLTATAVPTSVPKYPVEPLNTSQRESTTAQGTKISPKDTESIASALAEGSMAEAQQELSRSKPHSYGINDENETDDLAASTTSLDSIATAEVKLPVQVEQMDLESENGRLKSTSTFLISEIGVLTKRIQTQRLENERLMKLAESAAAIESQMQKVMEQNVSLMVKCDKMQNAFAMIDDESSLSVRTVTIYDCPHLVTAVEDDLDFIMSDVVVIYSMNPFERTVAGQKMIVRTIKIKCASDEVAQCIFYFLRWRSDYSSLRMSITCSQPTDSAASPVFTQAPANGASVEPSRVPK
ncbi:hypothetical protein V1525DRAFT_388074 [Lipomyces kononenkoae]|uniref:Uncharacterized protein n=1 Tax=Lipomyces kononenkoae TaxID=34357 RepID=A0ACC3T1U7_LIPKO